MKSKKLINRLSELSKKYHSAQEELSSKYHFDDFRDARINVFKHCYIVIDSTYVIILVRSRHLFDESWWTSLMDENLISTGMTEEQRKTFIYGFDTYVDSSFIAMLLFTVESAFRSFYSATFIHDPPFTFSKLYKKLLPAFGLDEYIELLKLASLTRNTLHNMGLYTLNDDTATWRNKTYHFTKNKKVELNDVYEYQLSLRCCHYAAPISVHTQDRSSPFLYLDDSHSGSNTSIEYLWIKDR
jgi:hypothetical protein